MKSRHAASLYAVIALALAAFTGTAFAGNGQGNAGGNGNGNGNGNQPAQPAPPAPEQPAAPQSADRAADHVKGQSAEHANDQSVKTADSTSKGQAKHTSVSVTAATTSDNSQGVKPSSITFHDTHELATSNKTKVYGNGQTAGQIAVKAGYTGYLHGPGNSQPHKALCGGHEVDVHALAHHGSKCGTATTSASTPTTASSPTTATATANVAVSAATTVAAATAPSANGVAGVHITKTTPTKSTLAPAPAGVKGQQVALKPAPKQKPAGGVLGATANITKSVPASHLPFTGLPLGIFAAVAALLILTGAAIRRSAATTGRT
jgi:hypothetical protein